MAFITCIGIGCTGAGRPDACVKRRGRGQTEKLGLTEADLKQPGTHCTTTAHGYVGSDPSASQYARSYHSAFGSYPSAFGSHLSALQIYYPSQRVVARSLHLQFKTYARWSLLCEDDSCHQKGMSSSTIPRRRAHEAPCASDDWLRHAICAHHLRLVLVNALGLHVHLLYVKTHHETIIIWYDEPMYAVVSSS